MSWLRSGFGLLWERQRRGRHAVVSAEDVPRISVRIFARIEGFEAPDLFISQGDDANLKLMDFHVEPHFAGCQVQDG